MFAGLIERRRLYTHKLNRLALTSESCQTTQTLSGIFTLVLPIFLDYILKLGCIEIVVRTLCCEQLLMASGFFNLSVIDDEYLVSIFNGRKSVCYDK